ncbi:hypothetical protein [Agrococcus sp. KRD186]|uniref:hypothetical protein n=1 Tax=Agrococcus sp. KRD186 TaxID=2729730 RepID=UPI0019D02717|nr:hypothetical protein [Agrococcus sp. KRD186]
MPLLVPLLLALAVVLAATMLWVWAGSIAHVRHGALVAAGVAVIAVAGMALLVTDASLEWAGWVLLAASVVALVLGWIGLARWGVPARR